MFSNVKTLNEIDVNWNTLISAKITKLIAVNFNVKLIYDRDVIKNHYIQFEFVEMFYAEKVKLKAPFIKSVFYPCSPC